MKNIIIIGISGISGAGKTRLTKALAKHLKATSLHWDDFDDRSTSPDDYVDWFERGQDYDEFDYSSLACVLSQLKKGNESYHLGILEKLTPTPYIIVDAPLGKAHFQTALYIDVFIHIDVPLDIAMARRILRNCGSFRYGRSEIAEELQDYLERSRFLFTEKSMGAISNSADLIINGAETTESQIDRILSFLNQPETHSVENNKKHLKK